MSEAAPPSPAEAAPAAAPPNPARARKTPRALWIALGLLAALVVAVVACEAAGWPFLARPLERMLNKAMKREVRLGDAAGAGTRIHLFGSLRIATPGLRIAAPDWSKEPYFVDAHGVDLALPYSALWRMRRGETLHVRALEVERISVKAERDADKRSSWQFGDAPAKPKAEGAGRVPEFDHLRVGSGDVSYVDVPLKLQLQADVQTDEGARSGTGTAASAAAGASSPQSGLKVRLRGRYDKSPVAGRLESSGALPLVSARGERVAPVLLVLDVGRMSLRFQGTASDVLSLGGLTGAYKLSGPSLAAIGDPLHVTLPSTGPIVLDGRLRKDRQLWNVLVDHAVVGSSHLSGAFQYDRRPDVPQLNGDLKGVHVLLADLAPTIGAAPAGEKTVSPGGRRLPQREFDLPALRAMNANVRIAVDRLELGSVFARPLSPLHAVLILKDGVLTIDAIDATTADGRLRGKLRLDGTRRPATWAADLRWNDVDLARWLSQKRKDNQPPYLTGRLDGQAVLRGSGNSTAGLLGTADGRVRLNVRGGTVSHLIVELAGIDVAQGLGMLVKGDDALKMSCAVADLNVKDGVMRPSAALVDTSDSTVAVNGSVSLASEQLDLRLIVSPKDFSPLALRSPILVRGTFAAPRVSLEAAPIGRKVAASVLLGLINPLAALIPLIDPGSGKGESQGCRELIAKFNAASQAPAATAASAPERTGERGRAVAGRPAGRPAAMPPARP